MGGRGSEDQRKAWSWLPGSDWGGGGGWPQTSGDSSESLFGFLTSTEESPTNEGGGVVMVGGRGVQLDATRRGLVADRGLVRGGESWAERSIAGGRAWDMARGGGVWGGGGEGPGSPPPRSKKRRKNPPSSKKNPGGDLVQSLFRRCQKMLLVELLEHSKRVVG